MADIYTLIPRVMADIGAVGKDSKNEAQGYKFRGIEAFYNAAHPALVKHGVFCCPQVLECESQERISGNGKPAIRVTVRVSHEFFGPDGSSIKVITCGEGIDSSDKATNKAMSAAMKYAFIELFSVPTQDIEDADKDSPEIGMRTNGKPVERITQDIPLAQAANILPDESSLISGADAKRLHLRFKQEVREELRLQADNYLYDFLGSKLYIDAAGNPSASAIPKDQYVAVGKAAIEYARTL